MADLEEKLKEAQGCRTRMIVTDGVFSMDGYIANLSGICDLAETCAEGRVVSVLEGGYDLVGLAVSTAAHVQALMERSL